MRVLVRMDDEALFRATVELVASTSRMFAREIELADADARQRFYSIERLRPHLQEARKRAAVLDALCLIILRHPRR